jgi:hypothetical protein
MANIKISQLPAATSPVAPTSELPINQGGDTKRAAISQLGFAQAGVGAQNRTIQNKLRDTVSVKDFGAVGDGVTDDTAAIQSAISAADEVWFPEGNYKVTASINVNKAMTIRVDGKIQTTRYEYQVNPPTIFLVTADNVTIEGSGSLVGPGIFTHAVITDIQYIPSLIKVNSADNVTIQNLTLVDVPQAGVIYTDSDYIKIVNCTFVGGDTVANCKDTPNVAGINYYAVYCYSSDYSLITGNKFVDDDAGNTFAEGIFMWQTNHSEVSNNFFKNMVDHDLYMYHPSGTTVGQNNYNTICNNISYTTLVNITQKIGSSLKVHGIYNNISGNNLLNTNSGIVLEQGSYSIISNNTISAFNAHGIIVNDLVSTNADGLSYITISNNTLKAADSSAAYGIYFRGDATYTTANCVGNSICGNTISLCGDPGGSTPSPIAVFHSNTSYFMDGTLIADNIIVGQAGVFGMYFDRVRFSKISGNIIKDAIYTPPWRGFHFVGNCSFNEVTKNTVRDDKGTPTLSIGVNFAAVSDTDNIMSGNILHSLYASRSANPWGVSATYRNIGDRNLNEDMLGYPVGLATAETVGSITATATVSLAMEVPVGARIIGCQLRVESALASGQLWDAAYAGGSTATIATAQAVAKNTKVNVLYNTNGASDITTNTLFVNITRNGGGSFTAQGSIRALVYYEALTTLGDAP